GARPAPHGRAGRDAGGAGLCRLRPQRSHFLVDERGPVLCLAGVPADGLVPGWRSGASGPGAGRSSGRRRPRLQPRQRFR
nr:hypothetical protein [Tanacetum cinerariifolium]